MPPPDRAQDAAGRHRARPSRERVPAPPPVRWTRNPFLSVEPCGYCTTDQMKVAVPETPLVSVAVTVTV